MRCPYLSRGVSAFLFPFNCIFTHLCRKIRVVSVFFFFFLVLVAVCWLCFPIRGPYRMENRTIMQINTSKRAHACACPAASGPQTSGRNLGKWSFALLCSGHGQWAPFLFLFLFLFFRLLFFSFPRGQAFPLTYVRREGREARDTIILPFFPPKKNRAPS